MTELSNADLVDGVEDVLSSTLSLARTITEEQGRLPTDCPGWTVKDNLAHMVGLEQVLNGAPEPDVELPPLDHVKKDFDAYMERHIHIRRGLPVSSIADELAGLLPRRIEGLRSTVAEGDAWCEGPSASRLCRRPCPSGCSTCGLTSRTSGGLWAWQPESTAWPRRSR